MIFITRYTCVARSLNVNLKFIKTINLQTFLNCHRWYVSALYIPGNKANKELSYLRPVINFDDYTDIQKYQNEFDLRGCKIDLIKLQEKWKSYEIFCSNKNTLEDKHRNYVQKLKTLQERNSDNDKEEIDFLLQQCKLIKEIIKYTNEIIWKIEETVIPQLLKLPNKLDQRTPVKIPTVLQSIGQKPEILENKKDSHLNIGEKLGLIDYKNPVQYFLNNEAALFECIVLSLSGKILNDNNYIRVSGSDFCRSIVMEGSGMDHENSQNTFIIQNPDKEKKEYNINQLHLAGSASVPALLAIYTKKVANTNKFPIKIFSSGRQYIPVTSDLMTQGLLSVCQASVIQTLTFVKEKDSEMYENELQNLIEITSEIYDKIGCHYQVVIKPISELNSSESMRISFEMWSVFLNQYIEVGYISIYGEYFSKRLLIGYQNSRKIKFPAAITGTLISIPKILACLLEENPKEFILSEQLQSFFKS